MRNSDDVLIIFVKNAEAGKVKTRLAKTVGNENALKVYKHLIQHTHDITARIPVDKWVFYSKTVEEFDLFEGRSYRKSRQVGEGLGDRMLAAFKEAFEAGYQRVSIIGSDCYDLNAEILTDAFRALHENEVVIGPAKDGGYYLLGMSELYADLFQNKKWSTEDVILDTMLDLKNLKLNYHLLPALSDVDHEKDLGPLRSLLDQADI